MGQLAGRNMAGKTEPYHHLPFFYSDMFELGYEAVGEMDSRLETFADWKRLNEEGVIVESARQLIAEPGPFTPKDP